MNEGLVEYLKTGRNWASKTNLDHYAEIVEVSYTGDGEITYVKYIVRDSLLLGKPIVEVEELFSDFTNKYFTLSQIVKMEREWFNNFHRTLTNDFGIDLMTPDNKMKSLWDILEKISLSGKENE